MVDQVPNKLRYIRKQEELQSTITNISKEVLDMAFEWIKEQLSYRYISNTELRFLKNSIHNSEITLLELWAADINKLHEHIKTVIGACNLLYDDKRILVVGLQRPFRWMALYKDTKSELKRWNELATII
jgi:hypothetical protein